MEAVEFDRTLGKGDFLLAAQGAFDELNYCCSVSLARLVGKRWSESVDWFFKRGKCVIWPWLIPVSH